MDTVDMHNDPLQGKIVRENSGELKAPKSIIRSVDASRAMHQKLRSNHLKRINLYKEIDGLIAGNPPFNPAELRAAGLQHKANFNDMSARAIFERHCLAYWNLLHNSVNLARFVIRSKDPQANYYANLMAAHWDFAVRTEWPSFTVNVASLVSQLVKFGVSPALFPDERDPRWRVVELNRFYVPDQQQADLDLLTTVMVETEFTVQYLWSVYEEFKHADPRTCPWNIAELSKLLLFIANQPVKDASNPTDLFELERRVYSGDISFERMYNDTVRIVSQLQREYSGKVSHFMFHRFLAGSGDTKDPTQDFLFYQPDQYQSINEALCLFTMNPGEFTIHANRGVGHKMYSLMQAKTMLDCSVFDMANWASTPIIKSSGMNAKEVGQIRFYPGVPTDIGSADFVQNTLGANVDNVVGAAQYFSNLAQFNIAYSGSDPATPDPDKGSLAPSQTRIMAFKEFSVMKNYIMHYYATFDHLIQGMTAKMMRSKEGYPGYDIARVWKERCLEDGVPEEIFELKKDDRGTWRMPRGVEVYATRAAGAGSQVAHLMGLQELGSISGSFGPREEKEFKRQYVIATVGPEFVQSFVQEEEPDESSGGASVAGCENAIMQAGKSPVFSPDNDHRSHFAVAMALAKQTIDQVQQQQIDVIQADSIFNVLVPHLSDHLQALESSPFTQQMFAQAKPMFEQVAKYAQLNRKNAAKAVQAKQEQKAQMAERQQQAMTEEQLKTMQVTNEERRKDLKLQAQAERQKEAGDTKAEALNRKVDSDIKLKNKQTDADIQIKAKKEGTGSSPLANTSEAEASSNPSDYLRSINGRTPSPYDIEGGGAPGV